MTGHRYRIVHGTAGADSFIDWLDQYLVNLQPWAHDDVTNDIPDAPNVPPELSLGAEYYQYELAFDWSEERSIIEDQIVGYIESYCDAYRVEHHACDHGEDDGGRCDYETVAVSDPPPSV